MSGVTFSCCIQYRQQGGEAAVPQLCLGYLRFFWSLLHPSQSSRQWCLGWGSWEHWIWLPLRYTLKWTVIWSLLSRAAVRDACWPVISTEVHWGILGRDVLAGQVPCREFTWLAGSPGCASPPALPLSSQPGLPCAGIWGTGHRQKLLQLRCWKPESAWKLVLCSSRDIIRWQKLSCQMLLYHSLTLKY